MFENHKSIMVAALGIAASSAVFGYLYYIDQRRLSDSDFGTMLRERQRRALENGGEQVHSNFLEGDMEIRVDDLTNGTVLSRYSSYVKEVFQNTMQANVIQVLAAKLQQFAIFNRKAASK